MSVIPEALSSLDNRLEHFEVRLGDNYTSVEEFDPMTWELCVARNELFPAGSTKHLYCIRPITARYLSVVIPRVQYLTICEIWVYGARGMIS